MEGSIEPPKLNKIPNYSLPLRLDKKKKLIKVPLHSHALSLTFGTFHINLLYEVL